MEESKRTEEMAVNGQFSGGDGTLSYAPNLCRHEVDTAHFSFPSTEAVRRVHRMTPDYQPTALRALPALASDLGIRAVFLKDESTRFGLKAFKGLGSIYAMYRMICRELDILPDTATLEMLRQADCQRRIQKMTFVTTTDGNHGKGVSWASRVFGCSAVVYMPAGTVEVRAEAIRQAGNAKVKIMDMRYDECVAWTARQAEAHGWFLIQDTAWDGYEEIPEWIMQGYTTMLYEAKEQMPEAPTHLFLQAGVGSMAGAMAAAARTTWGNVHIYTVEPKEVACFHDSFRKADGKAHQATGSGQTEMAGLNCAVPCKTAWELLGGMAEGGFACEDAVTERGIRYLNRNALAIIAGESGAVTTGLLLELRERKDLIKFEPDAVVLLLNTEGDTDPENYRRIITEDD